MAAAAANCHFWVTFMAIIEGEWLFQQVPFPPHLLLIFMFQP
jgi:hypothetical protein